MIKRYYYCVNCGHHGDFKRPKKRSIECQECSYKDLTELDEQKYNEALEQQKEAAKAFKLFT